MSRQKKPSHLTPEEARRREIRAAVARIKARLIADNPDGQWDEHDLEVETVRWLADNPSPVDNVFVSRLMVRNDDAALRPPPPSPQLGLSGFHHDYQIPIDGKGKRVQQGRATRPNLEAYRSILDET